MTDQPEELEHIPWSALADQASRTNRAWYLAAAVVALVAVGLVMSRTILADRQAMPAPVAPAASGPADTTTTTIVPSTVSTLPPLYSEADLMAAITAEIDRTVAAHAEWFVIDFFTRDFDHAGSAFAAAALPSGIELPTFPHEAGEGPIIYVEWAKALRVSELLPGRYRVLVAYRSVIERPQGTYLRRDVQAVEVLAALGAEGGVTMLDLPSPVPVPQRPETGPYAVATEPAPPAVREAVEGHLAQLGVQMGDAYAAPVAGGYRVETTARYDSAEAWPVAFHVDEQGRVLALGEIG